MPLPGAFRTRRSIPTVGGGREKARCRVPALRDQGWVLGGNILNLIALMASILAGFSFSVIVQLALAQQSAAHPAAIYTTFLAFLICTIALIIAVAAGMLLILPSLDRPLQGDAFLIMLVLRGMWI